MVLLLQETSTCAHGLQCKGMQEPTIVDQVWVHYVWIGINNFNSCAQVAGPWG